MPDTRTRDKYDAAIDLLTSGGVPVLCAWDPSEADGVLEGQDREDARTAHALFQWVTSDGTPGGYAVPTANGSQRYPGCLTQIRSGPDLHAAPTQHFTDAICGDNRILSIAELEALAEHPESPAYRTALEVFAEWQRRLDRELRCGAA